MNVQFHIFIEVCLTNEKFCKFEFFIEKRRDVLESEYARIVKTLYSGFPNEVDFCFNILTLMIAPGPYTLRLEKCPLLLSLIIAHAGVFGDSKLNSSSFLSFYYSRCSFT